MTPDLEILIVGGGPAGLSTWLHLHAIAPELARRTALIEKERYPRDKLCGGGVTALGDMLLQGLGITIDCPSVPIRRIDIRFGDSVHSLEQPGALRVVRRHEFDHALARAAVERGLELREGEAFVSFQREAPDRVRVQTTAGELTTRAIVGADGAQSAVRRSLNLGDDARLARLIEVVAPVDPTAGEFADGAVVFDFSPLSEGVQGYVWHFPCLEAGQACMNRGVYDSRLHPERERADLRAVLCRTLEAAQLAPTVVDLRSHPLRWFGPPGALAVPNVLLAGDAAGVDPLLGEGIAQSLDYGDFAARLLAAAFVCREFGFQDSLERASRHPLFRLLLQRGGLANAVYADRMFPRQAGPAIVAALLGGGPPATRSSP